MSEDWKSSAARRSSARGISLGLVACVALLGGIRGASAAEDIGDPDSGPPDGDDIIEAAPGADAAKLVRPAWCKNFREADFGTGIRRYTFHEGRGMLETLKRKGINDETLQGMALSSCLRPNDQVRQKWIQMGRQHVLNEARISDAELSAALGFFVKERKHREAAKEAACGRLASDTKDLDARIDNWAWKVILRCGDNDDAFAVDAAHRALQQPTAVAELVVTAECLRGRGDPEWDEDTLMAEGYRSRQVFCLPIGKPRLDAAAMAREATRRKLGEIAPVELAFYRGFYTGYIEFRAELWKRLAKKDGDIGRVMLAAPAEGYRKWMAVYEKNKASIDLARKYEIAFEANRASKKALVAAFDGCERELLPAFERHIRKQKPATTSEFVDAATDYVGSPLVEALVACYAIKGEVMHANAFENLLAKQAALVTSPRDAARRAANEAQAEIRADREDFPLRGSMHSSDYRWAPAAVARMNLDIVFPIAGGWSSGELSLGKGRNQAAVDGIVQKVQKKKGGILVSFRTVKWQEPTYTCTETGRIARITADGEIVYRQNCKRSGTATRQTQIYPVFIPKGLANGVKPGALVRIYAASSSRDVPEGQINGFALEVYKSKKRSKLVSVLGMKLR